MAYKDKKVKAAIEYIKQGSCLIYPTETLYALGADAFNRDACIKIFKLKGREPGKPFPLIIGSWEQIEKVTDRAKDILCLAKHFWPGPLSILVPARSDLCPLSYDQRTLTSVRWTSHPLAQKLCLEADVPLIATSANLSTDNAVADPYKLNPRLSANVPIILDHQPWPAGGPPSTLVQLQDMDRVTILRPGAISTEKLKSCGFEVIGQ